MENQQTVGTQFRILSILHAALCGGVIIVLFLFRYMVKHDANAQPNNNLVMEIIGIAIGFISVLLSRFLFFMRTRQALTTTSLAGKIGIFRSAFIVQMALLEGAALINAVFYYITKNDIHFFIGLGILLLMLFRRPSRTIAAMVLFNEMEDKQQIYDNSLPV